MRDITHMESVIVARLEEKLEKLKQAQRDTANQVLNDTKENAPSNLKNGYVESIKLSDTTYEDDVIKTSVYSDMLVGGDSEKWQNVPVSAFGEWGTGPLGEDSNHYDHEYPYTTDAPWNIETWIQMQMTGSWGRIAQPHFYPALQGNIALYKENIRKALKDK